jgi:hypothetical protein
VRHPKPAAVAVTGCIDAAMDAAKHTASASDLEAGSQEILESWAAQRGHHKHVFGERSLRLPCAMCQCVTPLQHQLCLSSIGKAQEFARYSVCPFTISFHIGNAVCADWVQGCALNAAVSGVQACLRRGHASGTRCGCCPACTRSASAPASSRGRCPPTAASSCGTPAGTWT